MGARPVEPGRRVGSGLFTRPVSQQANRPLAMLSTPRPPGARPDRRPTPVTPFRSRCRRRWRAPTTRRCARAATRRPRPVSCPKPNAKTSPPACTSTAADRSCHPATRCRSRRDEAASRAVRARERLPALDALPPRAVARRTAGPKDAPTILPSRPRATHRRAAMAVRGLPGRPRRGVLAPHALVRARLTRTRPDVVQAGEKPGRERSGRPTLGSPICTDVPDVVPAGNRCS